jgi:peptidoglycan/LPS O-acetylase OafA/YrhL
MGMRRDVFLDYIRALAALFVFFTHKGNKLPGGSIGVSIFFCLTGYLITKILIELPDLSIANIGKFIFRRWMRIWPLMAFQIFLTLGLMMVLAPSAVAKFLPNILSFLTFTGYGEWLGYSPGVLWTLRTEFWFYAIFPFVFLIFYPRGLMMYAAVAMVAIGWLSKFFIGQEGGASFAPFMTLVYLDQLMYGAICALVLASSRSTLANLFASKWWVWGCLVLNLAIAKLVPLHLFDAKFYLVMSLAALSCAVAILHHAAYKKEPPDNFISWIGRISFSIYLFHAVVIDYLPTGKIAPPIDTPLALTVTILISWATERWLERPGIKLSKAIATFKKRA